MSSTSLCDYSDAYILAKETVTAIIMVQIETVRHLLTE